MGLYCNSYRCLKKESATQNKNKKNAPNSFPSLSHEYPQRNYGSVASTGSATGSRLSPLTDNSFVANFFVPVFFISKKMFQNLFIYKVIVTR